MRRPEYYPAFLDLAGKQCILVGGGAVAERKARSLLAAGASLTVISPDLTPGLRRLKQDGMLTHLERACRKRDLRGALLVVAATSDAAVNREIARTAPCLVNVVDQPEVGNMIVPSAIRRGQLVVAVSTGGASPAAARTIRGELEVRYPQAVGAYIAYIGRLREKALKTIADRKQREQLFRELASPSRLELVRREGYRRAAAQAKEFYTNYIRGAV